MQVQVYHAYSAGHWEDAQALSALPELPARTPGCQCCDKRSEKGLLEAGVPMEAQGGMEVSGEGQEGAKAHVGCWPGRERQEQPSPVSPGA